MTKIIPAVLENSFNEVAQKIKQLEGRAEWVHLDVSDGKFTPKVSWQNAADLKDIAGKIKLEAHLMVESPEAVAREWALVCDRILVHCEATENLEEIIDFLNNSSVEVGVAVLLPTDLKLLESFSHKLKVIQLMAIKDIGYQGHGFEDSVYERIKFLRTYHPNVKIQVDGGVNLENAPELISVGVDNLVVGSAIWKTSDPLKTLETFKSLCTSTKTR